MNHVTDIYRSMVSRRPIPPGRFHFDRCRPAVRRMASVATGSSSLRHRPPPRSRHTALRSRSRSGLPTWLVRRPAPVNAAVVIASYSRYSGRHNGTLPLHDYCFPDKCNLVRSSATQTANGSDFNCLVTRRNSWITRVV